MTVDEFNSLIQNVMDNANNQAELSKTLATLKENYVKVDNNVATLSKTNAELSEANKKLKETNYDLFLKVGATTFVPPQGTQQKEEVAETKITIDDLFDENGNLK